MYGKKDHNYASVKLNSFSLEMTQILRPSFTTVAEKLR